MISPKLRFQSNKSDTTFWLELVLKDVFLRGLDAALLQMHYELPPTDYPDLAAARFHKMCGAMELKRILLNLPEIAKERVRFVSENLDQPK